MRGSSASSRREHHECGDLSSVYTRKKIGDSGGGFKLGCSESRTLRLSEGVKSRGETGALQASGGGFDSRYPYSGPSWFGRSALNREVRA